MANGLRRFWIAAAAIPLGIGLSTGCLAAEFKSEFISVQSQGTGPDVILLHGFGSSPDVWVQVAKEFDSRFRLHLVHVAGFAGSPAPKHVPDSFLMTIRDEVARYISEGRLKKPVLIGHSMGGLVALLVASQKPAIVGEVIVVDALPFYSLLFNPSATAEQVLPQAKAFEQQLVRIGQEQFEQQARFSASILTKTEEKKALILKWANDSDRKTYARIFREVMAYDARPELTRISCPVLVVYAFDDAMGMPEAELEKLYTNAYANLKGVQFGRINESFHFIMWDQPTRLNTTLNTALSR